MARFLKIVDVSLRDGLQNDPRLFTLEQRMRIAESLIDMGVQRFEIGAFVRYDKVPQMKPTAQLLQKVLPLVSKNTRPSVLVPNTIGMESAIASGVKEVAIFTSASEAFSRKNINCSIEESFERFQPVFQMAKKNKIKVRGYVSTCFVCPYEGIIAPKKVVPVVKKLLDLGAYEISIGDTLGVAVPTEVEKLFGALKKNRVPFHLLAGHFHDTRHTALANVAKALEVGISTFDASLGGLGGCPYAPGAAGNLALEDLLYFVHAMGFKTGISYEKAMVARKLML